MATHSNLKDLFTGIANSIRSKTGSTDPIVADNFPSEIAAISTGFPNGTEWTMIKNISVAFEHVHNANGIWVAGCSSARASYRKGLYYSTDGMTWTQSNITSNGFYHVHNANGIWVACGGDDNGLYYSPDGMTWTQSNITSGYFYHVHNANGIWVACGHDCLYYSVSWQPS